MSILMNHIMLNAIRGVKQPIILPAKTIRFKIWDENFVPRTSTSFSDYTNAGTSRTGMWTQVSSSPNIWDWYNPSSYWGGEDGRGIFQLSYDLHRTYFEILGANLSGVTSIRYLFAPSVYDVARSYNCNGLWFVDNITDSDSLTDLDHAFYDSSIKYIPLFDTSNVTNMSYAFSECESVQSAPLFDTSNVTRMDHMFSDCLVLRIVQLFDTSNVTRMDSMFNGCGYLQSVPLFDTSSVTTMDSMFYRCRRLVNIPLFDTSNVSDMDHMFYDCVNVESGALALYQQASTQANPPPNHSLTFHDCGANTTTGAAELAQIPSTWKDI